jgi:hypothetical protein
MLFALGMAGLAAYGSASANATANKNAYKNQLAINAGQKTANVNTLGEMQEQQRKTGFALTSLELSEQRVLAKQVASRANSNTAGASAAYAYVNIINQMNVKQGNVIVERDAQVRDLGKTSQRLAIGAQSNWNQEESKKKSSSTMLLEAAMAGAQAYSAGSDMQTSFNNAGGFEGLFGN